MTAEKDKPTACNDTGCRMGVAIAVFAFVLGSVFLVTIYLRRRDRKQKRLAGVDPEAPTQGFHRSGLFPTAKYNTKQHRNMDLDDDGGNRTNAYGGGNSHANHGNTKAGNRRSENAGWGIDADSDDDEQVEVGLGRNKSGDLQMRNLVGPKSGVGDGFGASHSKSSLGTDTKTGHATDSTPSLPLTQPLHPVGIALNPSQPAKS